MHKNPTSPVWLPDPTNGELNNLIAWGGQWCTSPDYAYVHESIVTEFIAEARKQC
jgi:aldehyde dehydrogenase (NAD+)